MLKKIIDYIPGTLKKADTWILLFKRIIYIACFVALCMIDQVIGSATGSIQYGLKNYTGVIIAIIILTSYKLKDFLKIPYLAWIILFFIGRYRILDWGQSNSGNYMELQTNLWGILIYGILLIRMFYLFIIEKKKPKMKWAAFLVWLVMMIGMVIIRSDLGWPKALFGAFVCFYLTEFEERDLNNLYSGMAEGIILGFFIIQGQAWMHRPYDTTRYLGMYSHANMNALFYVYTYCAVLCKWYQMKLKRRNVLLRFPLIVLAGLIVGTMIFTGGRTAFITTAVVTVVFLLFQMLSRRRWKLLELLTDGVILAASILICILPAYWMIRYIPTYVDEPIYFESDKEEEKIQKGDSIDSEKYIELDEALEEMFERYLWFQNEEETADTENKWKDWLKKLGIILEVEAANGYVEGDEVYIEPGTDSKHPLVRTLEEGNDWYDVRLDIYKYFLNKLTLIGEKGNTQGVWLNKYYLATHCHNVLLQIAYDFGIIIGVIFIFVILLLYNKIFVGLIERKSGSWYYRLFVTAGFATVFVVFGMLEIDWIYGQLPFTMFFIVQYVVYHKQSHELCVEQTSDVEQEPVESLRMEEPSFEVVELDGDEKNSEELEFDSVDS